MENQEKLSVSYEEYERIVPSLVLELALGSNLGRIDLTDE